jgi:hypothetical protein
MIRDMATNLKLDPKLISEAQRLGKKKTKREAVTEALLEYVRRHKVEGLISMFGTVDFDPAYDHKAERNRSNASVRKRKGAA